MSTGCIRSMPDVCFGPPYGAARRWCLRHKEAYCWRTRAGRSTGAHAVVVGRSIWSASRSRIIAWRKLHGQHRHSRTRACRAARCRCSCCRCRHCRNGQGRLGQAGCVRHGRRVAYRRRKRASNAGQPKTKLVGDVAFDEVVDVAGHIPGARRCQAHDHCLPVAQHADRRCRQAELTTPSFFFNDSRDQAVSAAGRLD